MLNGTKNIYDNIEKVATINNVMNSTYDLMTKETNGTVKILKSPTIRETKCDISEPHFKISIVDNKIEVIFNNNFDKYTGHFQLDAKGDDTVIKTIEKMYEIVDDAINKRKPNTALIYQIMDNTVHIQIDVDMIYFKEHIETSLHLCTENQYDVLNRKINYLMEKMS